MRCPHCAAPHGAAETCSTCGMPSRSPVVQPRLDALEVTRVAPVQVAVTRMQDLLTTEEEFGDVSIPGGDEPAPFVRPTQCRRCGTAAGESRLCEKCGLALWALPDAPSAGGRGARCGACGVDLAAGAGRCMACGQRI